MDNELKGRGNSLNYTFRMHDPRVGRFFATDPLEKDYPWYSPYQFSGNRLIDAKELEGLEPHVLFDDLQGAAINFGEQYNGYSIQQNKEIASNFYKVEVSKGVFKYAYTTPVIGKADEVNPRNSNDVPKNAVPGYVAWAHTHGGAKLSINMYDRETNRQIKQFGKFNKIEFDFDKKYEILDGDNNPSGSDFNITKEYTEKNKDTFIQAYTFTPSGIVWKSKANNGDNTVESVDIKMSRLSPSDPNSPLRINQNSPDCTPDVLPEPDNNPIKPIE